MGADLAIIESEEENNFIEKRISNLTGNKTCKSHLLQICSIT